MELHLNMLAQDFPAIEIYRSYRVNLFTAEELDATWVLRKQ